MKITVIGHICIDVINHPDGKETQGYGGIYYSLVALASIADPYTKIFPVFSIGNKDYNTLIENLNKYSNIDTDGIFKHDGPTNQVHLFYNEKQARIECSHNIAPPIPFKKIKSYLETNLILINMVSGFDITLNTLDEIRMQVREDAIPIYMDAHSLSLGVNGEGSRYRRPLTDWRRWLFMLHTVQMNAEEAANLTVEKYDELNFVKQVTTLNTNNVIITRSADGCTLYHDEHKQIQRFDYSGEKIERIIDSTGCGDVFAAAYCAKYIRSKNSALSAEFANKVAAYNAECAGSSELDKLSKFKINEIK